MNDVDTIDVVVKRATRRKHSAQFKAEVLEACRQPDASAAAIARLYNLNANVVHRWRSVRLQWAEATGCSPAACAPVNAPLPS